MGAEYTHEKLTVALSALIGTGTLQDRLESAFVSALSRLEPDEEDFASVELRERFRAIKEALSGSNGDVHATISAINDDEAYKLAQEILSLFNAVPRS